MGDRKSAPGSIIPIILFAALGYGIGLWQGHMSTVAADERTESVRSELKTAKDGLSKVDARANRLEARRHLDLTLTALSEKNDSEARVHLNAAVSLLKANAAGPYKAFADKADDLKSITEPTKLRDAVAGLGKELDSTLPIALQMSGGASQ
jgi:hypothetical protein